MKISEIITDRYKLRIPPTVYYDLLADVREAEEEQEPTAKNDLGVDLISREQAKAAIRDKFKDLPSRVEINTILNELPSVTPQLSSELEKNSKKLEKNFGELDCISRADAIRVASGYCHPSNVAAELAKLPSVTPQAPRWISVNEKLPEDRREVLVTAYWHETYQVMMASYFGDGLWWCVPFNNCGEHMQRLKPKAWMPLPKPYDPQESEGKE